MGVFLGAVSPSLMTLVCSKRTYALTYMVRLSIVQLEIDLVHGQSDSCSKYN